jgi:hypothetical protein
MQIHHLSNLQLIPKLMNSKKSTNNITILYKFFDKDGDFVTWRAIPHNIRFIDASARSFKSRMHELVE